MDQFVLEILAIPRVLEVQVLLGALQNHLLLLALTDPADQGTQTLDPPVNATTVNQCQSFATFWVHLGCSLIKLFMSEKETPKSISRKNIKIINILCKMVHHLLLLH